MGFGAVDVAKPYKFIGFGDIHGPKPYKLIGFGDIHGPKPYKLIGFGDIFFFFRFSFFVLAKLGPSNGPNGPGLKNAT